MEEITLQIGQKYKLKGNFLTSNYNVVYTGMPNDNTFSLAIIFSEGYQALSYNLYFPLNQRNIEIDHGSIQVLHVNDESIRCKITKT